MNVDFVQAEGLEVRHGFFGRQGGVSAGIYSSLNCGTGSADAPDAVAENRARVVAALGLGTGIATVHQVHSARVVVAERVLPLAERPQADGMVTNVPGLVLGILTADCAPILFADRDAGVVGAAHAGWKGALGGVVGACVEAMEALGAARGSIVAVVGPCISQRAYEVGPEFLEAFMAEDRDFARFFANGQGDRMQFDLPGFVLSRLREAGIGACEWTGHCTFSDESRFFSYRRTTHRREADYGRQISVIGLTAE